MTAMVDRPDGTVRIPGASVAPVQALVTALGPGGRWYVVSAGGATVRHWQVEPGPPTGTLLSHARLECDGVDAAAVAGDPDGDQIVVGLQPSGRMWRWHLASGQLLGDPPRIGSDWTMWWATPPTGRPVTTVDTGDGWLVVTAMADNALRAWDPATGAAVGNGWTGHRDKVWSITAARLVDGTALVVSGGYDGVVLTWDARTGARYGPAAQGLGHIRAMTATALPDGGAVVCVAGLDGVVHRVDAATGEPMGPPIRAVPPPDSPYGCVTHLACLPTPAGGLVLTGAVSRTLHLWDLVSGRRIGELDTGVAIAGIAAARLTDDTPVAVVADACGNVHRFDAVSGAVLADPVQPHGMPAGRVIPVEADGRIVLAVSSRSGVRRFDAANGDPVGDPTRPMPAFGWIFAVAALPDGRHVLAFDHDDGLCRLDLITGEVYEPTRDEEATTIWDLATLRLPDGRVIIAGAGHDWMVYRFDAATGHAFGEPLEGHPISVKAVTATHHTDGTPMLVSGCEAGQIRRWNALTGQPIGRPLPGDVGTVGDLAVIDHPHGRPMLVCVDRDGGLHRWDPSTGEPIGPTIAIPDRAGLIAADTDQDGIPTAFVCTDDYRSGPGIQRWRLDTGEMTGPTPDTFCTLYHHGARTMMVFSETDGSVTIRPARRLRAGA
jgi:WD40 repeat protein